MSFLPLHDCARVRRIEAEGKTAGGLSIPASGKEKPQEGEDLIVMHEADIRGVMA